MRDNLMGGLLAFGVAAPVVIVCYGGGTALLAAAFGGLAAWMSGLGWIAVTLVVALAFLVVVAACADRNVDTSSVVVEQPALSVEPTYTGKYK